MEVRCMNSRGGTFDLGNCKFELSLCFEVYKHGK